MCQSSQCAAWDGFAMGYNPTLDYGNKVRRNRRGEKLNSRACYFAWSAKAFSSFALAAGESDFSTTFASGSA